MSYHIPPTGSIIHDPRGPWNLGHFDIWVTYMTSHPYRLWEQVEPVPGIPIDQFAAQVGHEIHPNGMGVFPHSQVVRFKETDQLYLCVPQTGRCVYFRLHES